MTTAMIPEHRTALLDTRGPCMITAIYVRKSTEQNVSDEEQGRS